MSETTTQETAQVQPTTQTAASEMVTTPSLKFAWSPQINELAAALAKAQGEMRNASKDSANPFYGSKYADLAAVVDVIRKPLADNGLAYVQPFTTATRLVTVSTVLMHSSGQWMSTEATFPVLPQAKKNEPPPPPTAPVTNQAYGSAVTYLRRYALQSMLGVPAEDDDGNEGSGNHAPAPKPSAAEQVRGAVQRPATTSAKTAAAPAQSKPEPMPPAANPALAMRFSLLWEAAKATGMKAREFDEWRTKALGDKELRKSSQLSAADLDHLEQVWKDRAKPSTTEPGAEG